MIEKLYVMFLLFFSSAMMIFFSVAVIAILCVPIYYLALFVAQILLKLVGA